VDLPTLALPIKPRSINILCKDPVYIVEDLCNHYYRRLQMREIQSLIIKSIF
jgi:hypothetical protein